MEKKYTRVEELLNGITHGIGIIFGIVALTMLLYVSIKNYNVSKIASFSIYGACIIMMFTFSTLYHGITRDKVKKILRVFDHSSIFLFIAGTYTPVVVLTLEGYFKVGILIAIWTIALGGIIFKVFTYGKFDKFKLISLSLYIGMGWIAIIPIRMIIQATSINFFIWILAGGLLYTLGTIFYSIKKIPYNHAIWHLFVLAASITHFLGIYIHLG